MYKTDRVIIVVIVDDGARLEYLFETVHVDQGCYHFTATINLVCLLSCVVSWPGLLWPGEMLVGRASHGDCDGSHPASQPSLLLTNPARTRSDLVETGGGERLSVLSSEFSKYIHVSHGSNTNGGMHSLPGAQAAD